MRHRESGQPRFRPGADTGCAFVADLAAGAGRGARKRSDRRRMIVRLDLHQDMHDLPPRHVASIGIRIEAPNRRSLHHGGVVGIGHDRPLRADRVRVADHREQRLRLLDAVDNPVRVEDLVPAVLGIRLREHHQLDVGRVASLAAEMLEEIVDLVGSERQAQCHVGVVDCGPPAGKQIDSRQRPRRDVREQSRRAVERGKHRFGHAVVDERQERRAIFARKLRAPARRDTVRDAALDARDRRETAVVRDVGGLGRPGRNRSGARNH